MRGHTIAAIAAEHLAPDTIARHIGRTIDSVHNLAPRARLKPSQNVLIAYSPDPEREPLTDIPGLRIAAADIRVVLYNQVPELPGHTTVQLVTHRDGYINITICDPEHASKQPETNPDSEAPCQP
jgi:hypothetical protein